MRAIVIGAGQVGSSIIGALAAEGADVVAIDWSENKLRELRDTYDIQTLSGSGSNPSILSEAGVVAADMLVAVTNSDEVNMVACAIAQLRAPNSIRVARIRESELIEGENVLGQLGFGVDHAINPEVVAVRRLTDILKVPIASDVADCGKFLKLVGIRLPPGCPIDGKTVAELRTLAPDLKVLLATRVREGESRIPDGNDDVRAGDTLFTVIHPNDLPALAELLQLNWRPTKRVTIAGGGPIGAMLAASLEKEPGFSIKLIEPDVERAHVLAERLEKTLVLQGSPTDESLLLEENIRDCDAFIAALPEPETNVMAALNAKRLGAYRVIALIEKLAYVPIIENAGVDAVVSPRALAIGTILHHIRKGRVKNVIPYGVTGQTEALEFEALETADAVDKPLKSVKFPDGVVVGAISRGEETIIPDGNDVILPGDNVFVFASKKAIPKLEKMMAVKFEFF